MRLNIVFSCSDCWQQRECNSDWVSLQEEPHKQQLKLCFPFHFLCSFLRRREENVSTGKYGAQKNWGFKSNVWTFLIWVRSGFKISLMILAFLQLLPTSDSLATWGLPVFMGESPLGFHKNAWWGPSLLVPPSPPSLGRQAAVSLRNISAETHKILGISLKERPRTFLPKH